MKYYRILIIIIAISVVVMFIKDKQEVKEIVLKTPYRSYYAVRREKIEIPKATVVKLPEKDRNQIIITRIPSSIIPEEPISEDEEFEDTVNLLYPYSVDISPVEETVSCKVSSVLDCEFDCESMTTNCIREKELFITQIMQQFYYTNINKFRNHTMIEQHLDGIYENIFVIGESPIDSNLWGSGSREYLEVLKELGEGDVKKGIKENYLPLITEMSKPVTCVANKKKCLKP